MPLYRYKAVAEGGDILSGNMDAPDRAALVQILHSQGRYPLAAEEIVHAAAWDWLHGDILKGRVSANDVRVMVQQLATLLHAGLTLERALEILAGLAKAERLRQLLDRLLERIRSGASFADAAAEQGKVFPPFFIGMVRAGQAGGALEQVLRRLAEFLEKSHAVRENIKSALIYPVLLLLLSAASVVVLLTVVLPQFRPLFEDTGKALPTSTRIIIAAGDDFSRYWWVLALGIVALACVLRARLRHPASRLRWDAGLLRVPLLGNLIAKIETARFGRILGTLLASGVTLLPALRVSHGTVTNTAVAKAVEAVMARAREGEGLAEPLQATGVFPDLAVQLILVGEETGALDEMLFKVADIYDREVRQTIERLMALLVPALTVGIGIVVAGIIASILVAILSVYQLAM